MANQHSNLEMIVERKLEWDMQYTRKAIIERARSLAERLTRLADGLERDPEHGFNTIGELQGNGVELDTWCHKLGSMRETLKVLRQAIAADAEEGK